MLRIICFGALLVSQSPLHSALAREGATVDVKITYPSNRTISVVPGTFIAPSVLVLAAHVLRNFDSGGVVRVDDSDVESEAVVVHPQVRFGMPNGINQDFDLSVVLLPDNFSHNYVALDKRTTGQSGAANIVSTHGASQRTKIVGLVSSRDDTEPEQFYKIKDIGLKPGESGAALYTPDWHLLGLLRGCSDGNCYFFSILTKVGCEILNEARQKFPKKFHNVPDGCAK